MLGRGGWLSAFAQAAESHITGCEMTEQDTFFAVHRFQGKSFRRLYVWQNISREGRNCDCEMSKGLQSVPHSRAGNIDPNGFGYSGCFQKILALPGQNLAHTSESTKMAKLEAPGI